MNSARPSLSQASMEALLPLFSGSAGGSVSAPRRRRARRDTEEPPAPTAMIAKIESPLDGLSHS
jgi:hypothetical protein